MKTSSIIAALVVLGAIGLSLWMFWGNQDMQRPPSELPPAVGSAQGSSPPSGSAPRAGAPAGSPGSAGSAVMPQGSDGRPTAASPDSQSPTSPRAATAQGVGASASAPSGGTAMGSEANGASGTAEGSSAGSSATAGKGSDPRVVEALTTARQHPREDERLGAVRWLGDNAGPEQFDALQQIQINDPSPEVRRAAETAVNTVRERYSNSEWPGVPKNANPQDYMRNVPPPP